RDAAVWRPGAARGRAEGRVQRAVPSHERLRRARRAVRRKPRRRRAGAAQTVVGGGAAQPGAPAAGHSARRVGGRVRGVKDLPPDILHRIGDTSLLPLRHIVPRNGSRILLKLESENPTGSMKDRMALAMIEAAEADGRLSPGVSVVEYTGGSTGVSLSLVCAVKGYPLHIVSSDAFSAEKLD